MLTKNKELSDISIAKVGLFGMSRDFHFGVCNHGKPHTSSCMARERKLFYQGKVRWEVIVTESPWFSLAESLPGKERSVSSFY